MYRFFLPHLSITRTSPIFLKKQVLGERKLPPTFTVLVQTRKIGSACFWHCRYLIFVHLVFHIFIFYKVVQIARPRSGSFIDGNITNILLSISCGLEVVDRQVKYCHLFQGKSSCYLKLSSQLELFPWSHDSMSYRKSTVDLFWCVISLSSR